jgi:hypothetical protein
MCNEEHHGRDGDDVREVESSQTMASQGETRGIFFILILFYLIFQK